MEYFYIVYALYMMGIFTMEGTIPIVLCLQEKIFGCLNFAAILIWATSNEIKNGKLAS